MTTNWANHPSPLGLSGFPFVDPRVHVWILLQASMTTSMASIEIRKGVKFSLSSRVTGTLLFVEASKATVDISVFSTRLCRFKLIFVHEQSLLWWYLTIMDTVLRLRLLVASIIHRHHLYTYSYEYRQATPIGSVRQSASFLTTKSAMSKTLHWKFASCQKRFAFLARWTLAYCCNANVAADTFRRPVAFHTITGCSRCNALDVIASLCTLETEWTIYRNVSCCA